MFVFDGCFVFMYVCVVLCCLLSVMFVIYCRVGLFFLYSELCACVVAVFVVCLFVCVCVLFVCV